jgi:hypothetical protein
MASRKMHKKGGRRTRGRRQKGGMFDALAGLLGLSQNENQKSDNSNQQNQNGQQVHLGQQGGKSRSKKNCKK